MANTLKTRIVLRNDSKSNWEAVKANDTSILLKGEVGVEFNPDATSTGSITKFKIGDGVHKWEELPYYEETFEDDLVFTHQFGKYSPSNGQVTVPAAGKTMTELLLDAYQVATNPTVDNPSVSLTTSGGNGEVGTTFTLPTATLKVTDIGSYTWGGKDSTTSPATTYGKEATGVTFAVGNATITQGSNSKSNASAMVKNSTITLQATGGNTYADGDTTFTFSGTAAYTPSTKINPVNNLGSEVPSLRIGYGKEAPISVDITDATATFTGWRKMFMGAVAKDATVNSVTIRGIGSKTTTNVISEKAVTGTAKTFTAPVGTEKLLIAFPTSLTTKAPSVEYFTMSWEGFGDFAKVGTIKVADAKGTIDGVDNNAVDYEVYAYTPSGALKADTQFRVTLKA